MTDSAPPPPPPGNKYTEVFFQQWLDKNSAMVKTKLQGILDEKETQLFLAACHTIQDDNAAKKDAESKRDEVAKHKPVDQDALDKANAAVQAATEALAAASDAALEKSTSLLDQAYNKLHTDDDTRHLLMVASVLVHGTPKGLAAYCQTPGKEDHAKALVQLLIDQRQLPLLQDMMMAGGARNGQYGPALEIYTQLSTHIRATTQCKDDDKKVKLLQRLALAVALELSDPLPEFHQDETFVDPIKRYLHYEQAWMFGELDPVFETTFGVWELRMVINSVAPNDQLGWGRDMLRNYRPDLMTLQDRWRYCRVVRTDVYYTGQPNWDPTRPLDYPQILSGGGECGPRAWMGRFICKAFGIPTWGVREPGHAAMARWTPNEGWVVCLGAAMPNAWWENQCGLYFQLETTARKACATPTPDDPNGIRTNVDYGEKVMSLEWIADILGEAEQQVKRECLADPTALWRSLSLLQRRRLSQKEKPPISPLSETAKSCGSEGCISSHHNGQQQSHRVVSQLDRILAQGASIAEEAVHFDAGTILIPAASCDKEKHNGNVVIMDSFLGGKQLFLNQDGSVTYTLPDPPSGKYELSCRFVTVHDAKVKPPFQLTIDGGETCNVTDDSGWELVQGAVRSCYAIELPYTKGMWDETKPIVIDLPKDASAVKISLTRDKAAMGMALKDIKLVPVAGLPCQ